jgi:hypothetical protein
VFDADEENTEALEISNRYGEWIKNNYDMSETISDCLTLNRIQIEKRQSKFFSIADLRLLENISKSNDITHKCAAFILLEDWAKAKQCLDEMDDVTKKRFESYPEYFLFKNGVENQIEI